MIMLFNVRHRFHCGRQSMMEKTVLIEPCYTQGYHEVMPWLRKIPLKYSRGYEVKYKNPEVLCITYKDSGEKAYLIKTYSDYIDEVI